MQKMWSFKLLKSSKILMRLENKNTERNKKFTKEIFTKQPNPLKLETTSR